MQDIPVDLASLVGLWCTTVLYGLFLSLKVECCLPFSQVSSESPPSTLDTSEAIIPTMTQYSSISKLRQPAYQA